MKVIAFSLSHFQPSLKGSKEPSKKVASLRLSFRNFGFGKEHAAPDFSEGTWRGFLVLMAFSLRSHPRIVSLRLDSYVFSLRSSNSTAVAGENELPRTATWTLNVNFVPMSFLAISLIFFLGLAVSFGPTSLLEPLLGILMRTMSHGMGLGQP